MITATKHSLVRHRMFRRFGAALTAFGLAVLPALSGVAAAHPLGNFSVNRYARIEVTPGQLQVHYVLDLAEIPAFQELPAIDSDRDGSISLVEREQYARVKAEDVRRGLRLTLQGIKTPLTTADTRLNLLDGQGGLETLRLEALYTAPHSGGELTVTFADTNEPSHLGWREIIVVPSDGVALGRSSVPQHDVTAALTRYPEDLLSSPLNVREASFSASVSVGIPSGSATLQPAAVTTVERGLSSLPLPLSRDMTLAAMLAALVGAAGLGAIHALSPGHGKTLVAAYLVGSRGSVSQAVLLGLTVTATHTIGVYVLGIVTLVASAYILPERLYPVLSLAAGLMVLVVGVLLLQSRLRQLFLGHSLTHGEHDYGGHGHSHEHGLSYDHGHGHEHLPPEHRALGLGGLLALGISGGLLPCPSAVVIMLGAIALRQTGLGLLLIVAFSIGLAGVVTGLGVAVVLARDRLQRAGRLAPPRLLQPALQAVPVLAALVVLVAGIAMTVQGAAQL